MCVFEHFFDISTQTQTNVVSLQNGCVIGTYLAMEHMRKDKGGKGGVILFTNSLSGTPEASLVDTIFNISNKEYHNRK